MFSRVFFAWVLWILLIAGSLDSIVSAQSKRLRFGYITKDDGLETYVVESLYQDSQQYVWVGTQGGLNRYDGATMRSFLASPTDTSKLSHPFVQAILESPQNSGFIWVGTEGGGINRFNPSDESFSRFVHDENDPETISHNNVKAILEDHRSQLWVGTYGGGLNKFDPISEEFTQVFKFSGADSTGMKILDLHESSSYPGWLWVGTNSGLYLYNIFQGSDLLNQQFESKPLSSLHSVRIEEIVSDPVLSNVLWVGTEKMGLIRLEVRLLDGDTQPVIVDSKQFLPGTRGISSRNISTILPDERGTPSLWIGSMGGGLDNLDLETLQVTNYKSSSEKNSIADNEIRDLLIDKHGLLWVGTWGNGISKQYPATGFYSFRHNPDSTAGLPGESIFDIRASRKHRDIAWLGFQNGGLGQWNYKDHRVELRFTGDKHPLKNVDIVAEDNLGRVWIGPKADSLHVYDWDRGRYDFVSLKHDGIPGHLLSFAEYPAGSSKFWFGTQENGIFVLDVVNRKIKFQYRHNEAYEHSVSADKIWDFFEDGEYLWIATEGGSVSRFDSVSRRFEPLEFDEKTDTEGIENILAIEKDNDENLWFGTSDHGLKRYNPVTKVLTGFSEREGVPHQTVGTLVKDLKGDIWMGTSQGIARISPVDSTIHAFGIEDGIHGDIVHYGAGALLPEGAILMGGREGGLTFFWPDSVIIPPGEPEIRITSVIVEGERMTLQQFLDDNPMNLKHDENNLKFEFSSMHYVVPNRNRYQSKLEVARQEEGWDPVTNVSSKSYSNLGPGKYTFLVHGSDAYGRWSDSPAAISFRIKQPYWLSWWFLSLIGTSLVGLVVAAYQYRIYQMQRVEKTRHEIANDLHDEVATDMTKLALNLEFESRLASSLEEMKALTAEFIAVERKLVSNLRSYIWLIDTQDNKGLVDLVERIDKEAGELLKGYRYEFVQPDNLPTSVIGLDIRNNIFRFFKEALTNAVKHSQADRFGVRIYYRDNVFTLEIEDNGKGFDTNVVKKGKGQSSMRERAEKIDGKFELHSVVGEGTIIRLTVDLASKLPWYHVFSR